MAAALTKPGATAPAVALLPAWTAFTCAGLCTIVAGYIAASVQSWTQAYSEFEQELPWITQAVVDAGLLLPAGMVLVALLLLAAPTVRVSAARARDLRPGVVVLAVGAAGTSSLLLTSLYLVFWKLQKAML